jgi:hypothetical protein
MNNIYRTRSRGIVMQILSWTNNYNKLVKIHQNMEPKKKKLFDIKLSMINIIKNQLWMDGYNQQLNKREKSEEIILLSFIILKTLN